MAVQTAQQSPLPRRRKSTSRGSDAPLHSRVPRFLRSPLRLRIYVLVVTAAALAIFAVSVASTGNEDAAHAIESEHFQTVTAAGAANLAARIDAVQSSLAMADVTLRSASDLAQICGALAAAPQHPYQRVFVFTPDGSLQCASVPGTQDRPETIRGNPYVASALSTGRDQVSGPIAGTFTGRLSIAFVHPVQVASSVAGVVVGGIDVADMVRPDLLDLHAGRLILLGREGERFETGGGDAADVPAEMAVAAGRARAANGRCPVIEVADHAWSCAAVGGTGLVLAVANPSREVFAASSGGALYQRYRAISVMGVALLAAAALDFLFVRRMRLAYQASGLPALSVFDLTNQDEVDVLREWAGTTSTTIERLRSAVEGQAETRQAAERELLTLLAEAAELRFPFLRGHGDRVERYARQIGTRLGLRGEDLERLAFAARVHDLGRIEIPDAIHLKAAPLEPIDMAQVQLHSARGAEMARRMGTVSPEVTRAIQHHHERWDGAGYPDGLAGVDIPLWARVIAVADAYDAMTEDRPYRPRFAHAEAERRLLEGAGKQWDSTVVHAFIEVVEMRTEEVHQAATGPGASAHERPA